MHLDYRHALLGGLVEHRCNVVGMPSHQFARTFGAPLVRNAVDLSDHKALAPVARTSTTQQERDSFPPIARV